MPHHPRGNSSQYFTRHRHCRRKGGNQGSGRRPDFYDDYAGSKARARREAAEKKAETRAASDAEAARQRQLEATFVSTKPKPPPKETQGSSSGIDAETRVRQGIDAYVQRTGKQFPAVANRAAGESWGDYEYYLKYVGIL